MEKKIIDLTSEEIKKICRIHKKNCYESQCPLCIGETDNDFVCFSEIYLTKMTRIIDGAKVEL